MKFSLYPIKNIELWKIYKKQMNAFWTAEEIDFTKDKQDFNTLSLERQNIIKLILAFFSNSDGIVNFNIQRNLLNFEEDEITYNYVFQMTMEQIHNECYSLMIDNLIDDDNEKDKLLNSITEIPIIQKISDWGLKYSSSNTELHYKILVFIVFEGIMFSGAFAIIFWIKNICGNGKNFMSGLVKSNELISRDEGIHTEFGIEIFKHITKHKKIYALNVNKIIIEGVNITFELNKNLFKIKDEGINVEMMNDYTMYVADRVLIELGYSKIYNKSNPFSFMDTIGMVQKTNFHESRPTEYKRANLKGIFKIEDDF